MIDPGIGRFQIMGCENLKPVGKKDSLEELIDYIHYYHYLNDYDDIEEITKIYHRFSVKLTIIDRFIN